jgi:SAM-dependent methyltransferase
MDTQTRLELFDYDAWEPRQDGWIVGSAKGDSKYDNLDFHVDLGCGTCPKGRIAVDVRIAPGVNIIADLDTVETLMVPLAPGEDASIHQITDIYGLPFENDSIKSIISHHAMEHVGFGFMRLMDEIYRVLQPGGIFRVITPLFPSWNAVSDPDHKRYFMAWDNQCTWDAFCGTPDNCWQESFSVPYSLARFTKVEQIASPIRTDVDLWSPENARELRVALRVNK